MARIQKRWEDVSRLQHVQKSGAVSSTEVSSTFGSQVNGQAPNPEIHMNLSCDTRLSIAVDPVALITTECITVTSAMRKHARWAHSSVSAILGGTPSVGGGRDTGRLPRHSDKSLTAEQRHSAKVTNGVTGDDDTLASRWGLRGKKGKSMQDNPLLSAFARLRNDLRGCTGQTDTKLYLRREADPF